MLKGNATPFSDYVSVSNGEHSINPPPAPFECWFSSFEYIIIKFAFLFVIKKQQCLQIFKKRTEQKLFNKQSFETPSAPLFVAVHFIFQLLGEHYVMFALKLSPRLLFLHISMRFAYTFIWAILRHENNWHEGKETAQRYVFGGRGEGLVDSNAERMITQWRQNCCVEIFREEKKNC